MMHKLVLAAMMLFLVAFRMMAQDESLITTNQWRCDTVAEILVEHGDLPLFRQHKGADVPANASWRTVNETLGPLARAYGCPPVAWESYIGPTNIEMQEPDATNPEAHISFPPPVYVVRHQVAIRGTVTVANLQSFYIEFRPLDLASEAEQDEENAHTWYPATLPRITHVKDDILGTWNTKYLQDGLYELRLTINTISDPKQNVYLSPIRVEMVPSFAVAKLEIPASGQLASSQSGSDSADPLLFTSEEYDLSPVIGPLSIPKGFNRVRWKKTAATGDVWLSIHLYALTPCFEFHETGADETVLFGNVYGGEEETEVLRVVEEGCQILMDVSSSLKLKAWEIEIQSIG